MTPGPPYRLLAAWPSGNPACYRAASPEFESSFPWHAVGNPMVLSSPLLIPCSLFLTPLLFFLAPRFFLSTGSILPRVMGDDLTSPTMGTGTPKVPGKWSPPSLPPPPPHPGAPTWGSGTP